VSRTPVAARLRARFFGAVVTLTDLLPPRVRYGYAHRMTRAAFSSPLPAVGRAVSRGVDSGEVRSAPDLDLTCAILADHLDVGGIGSVVEMLATHFAAEGVRAVVVCHGDGERAQRLRRLGIDVRSVTDAASAREALTGSGARVAQLHSAPEYLERAAMATDLPLVTVMHNTEIHYTASKWTSYRTLLERSAAGVAVSETVREYHARHVAPELAGRIAVVPNGAPALAPATAEERLTARAAVAEALGVSFDQEVLFVCLARYDSQKNIAGATVAFARAAEQRDDIHLIFAGDPSDWAELRRATALRDLRGGAHRIHFLGNSDAVTLLTAGDAFLLDSFFEGWPVAATEAAAAGLPLVLSEMGGARELVSRDPGLSVMTPNPAGDAAGISDRLVRAARRRTRAQQGASEFEAAVLAVAARVAEASRPLAPRSTGGVGEMLHSHARVLREVAETGL
jgi:glycosyltransferase involved in cell wall biosynthesis